MREKYKKQVELLLDILPHVMEDKRLALKGGTAINLFYRDYPRLSVDVDLTYLPIEDRETSFKNIHLILKTVKMNLEKKLGVKVKSSALLDGNKEVKLFVFKQEVEVNIEPNFVVRGCLFDSEIRQLSKMVEVEYEKSVEVQCLSFADTYGGKICAALDRQHPRDFFDIKILLENEGITEEIKDAFIFI